MSEINQLIDEIVKHKKWGEGTVKSVTEENIGVFFENTDTGPRTVIFQFPQAFNAGYLVLENFKLIEIIQSVINSRACIYCNDTTQATKVIDGKRVCEKCRRERTVECGSCRKATLKENATHAIWSSSMYTQVQLCPTCLSDKTFRCEECENVYSQDAFKSQIFQGCTLCSRCISSVASECFVCGKFYEFTNGEALYSYDYDCVEICDECLEQHAFKCSICDSYRILQDRFVSPNIPMEENICLFCIVKCSSCGEMVTKNNAHTFDDKKYCLDCWGKLSRVCRICKNEFIPPKDKDCLCPWCVESKAYEKRLQQLDLPTFPYKQLRYSQLDYLDRCQLFTSLYSFCTEDMAFQLGGREGEPFKYIVLDIFGRKVVVTYLSREVVGGVMCSENVTMTELRSRKGRLKVYEALEEWKKTSTTIIELPVGKMKILNYPVLLRVQTSYDRIYGKEWSGPYDYIEIGNYGDTTNFYIIGTIN